MCVILGEIAFLISCFILGERGSLLKKVRGLNSAVALPLSLVFILARFSNLSNLTILSEVSSGVGDALSSFLTVAMVANSLSVLVLMIRVGLVGGILFLEI